MNRAVTLVTSWVAGNAGHSIGDYLEQPDRCAAHKQQQGRAGWHALVRHVVGYAACQVATRAVAYRAAGIRVPVVAQAAGALTEAVLHGVIDDGRLLARYADATGKQGFVRLGAPRVVNARTVRGEQVYLHDSSGRLVSWDNPNPSSGRAVMDQAMHLGWQIPIGAVVTTLATNVMRRRR